MKYTFDNRIFNSKKAVDVCIRDVKNDYLKTERYNVINSSHKLFPFFEELVSVHNDRDDKIGCGIEYFYFVKDGYGNDQLRICRTNRSTIDCSCVYSKITQRNEQSNYNLNLNSALRDAIRDQIHAFFEKQEFPLQCFICSSGDKCEIDHIIPFHHIRDEFFKIIDKDKIPTQFDDDLGNTCCRVFKQDDADFKEKWKTHHQNMATFQVLCKTCNRKKGGQYIQDE